MPPAHATGLRGASQRTPTGLRSDAWLRGDDEVALANRVALASAGLDVSADGGRPVIGVANSASDLNPCNLPLRDLAGAVRQGVLEAGGVPVEFGSIPLGEDLMKPSAMLYRNLLSIEIEEIIRSYPLDGIVLLAGCDKTVPGSIMGAVSADLPMVLVTSGSRAPGHVPGQAYRLWQRPVAALGRAAGRPPRRRGLAGAGTLPGLRYRDLQHDGHRLDHGHPGRDARADDARLGHDPGRVPAGPGRGREQQAAARSTRSGTPGGRRRS